MQQSEQPQWLIAISAGYLVFIGLIVAASASVLASDSAADTPVWARALFLLPLAVSVLSGIAALIGANAGHNLGRRLEKLAKPNLTGSERARLEADVIKARRFATDAIWWALAGAIVSSLLLFVAILPIVFHTKADPSRPPPLAPLSLQVTPSTFELLGEVSGFRLSDPGPIEGDVQGSIEAIRRKWCVGRKAGRDGVILVIGSTDRIPLRRNTLRRFNSNTGLAQARANSVVSKLFPGERPRSIIALAAGPTNTPVGYQPLDGGSDRKVTVWALWQPGQTKKDAMAAECQY